jgi:hypothetical protein
MSTNDKCTHGNRICSMCVIVSDAAKRASDIVNGYAAFTPYDDLINCYVAIRLSDGGHDGVLYRSKREAVRRQSDEKLCAYYSYRFHGIRGTTAKDMQLFLDFHRVAYDSGFRLPDPDDRQGGKDLIMPITYEQMRLQTIINL